ncbi:MAG: nucleotidyltransferase domain-containing protein [Thaumarchaeota archaeon]|nr:nucleotidyltransferase domain-containing protein [Nitrososphaerota archaeon]
MNEEPSIKFRRIAEKLTENLLEVFGEELVSVTLFGSAARGESREDSDIDLLIVIENLPKDRFERYELYREAEEKLGDEASRISPILKTPEEASRMSPLYLDLVEDSIILYDKNDFMKKILERLRKKLKNLGAKRVRRGKSWYWILKPDLKFGEVLEIE